MAFIRSDGNGKSTVNASPKALKFWSILGPIIVLVLALSGWIFKLGSKSERLEAMTLSMQECSELIDKNADAIKDNSIKIGTIEGDIKEIKNDIGWIRRYLEGNK